MADQPGGYGRHSRWNRAADSLVTKRSGLLARLAEFAMMPTPTGPQAESLITDTLDALDELVPIGAVKTQNDLIDAAASVGHKVFPPIPTQVTSAQYRISESIAHLAPNQLRCAATQLGLNATTIEWGVQITLIRERKRISQQARELLADVDFDEVGYPDADSDSHDAGGTPFRAAVADAVHSLQTQQPLDWSSTDIDSLRCAIALHLAQIGDAFLRASEGSVE